MHLLLAALCDDARLLPDGKLDVRGAFYDLAAPGFPARQDRMVLALALEWDAHDEGRFRFRVELAGDAPRPAVTVDGHSDVSRRDPGERPARTFLVMPLEEVVFPRAGPYRMTVRVKGEELRGPTLHLWEVPDGAGEE